MDKTVLDIIKALNLCEEDEEEMIDSLERGFSVCLEFDYNGKICYKFD